MRGRSTPRSTSARRTTPLPSLRGPVRVAGHLPRPRSADARRHRRGCLTGKNFFDADAMERLGRSGPSPTSMASSTGPSTSCRPTRVVAIRTAASCSVRAATHEVRSVRAGSPAQDTSRSRTWQRALERSLGRAFEVGPGQRRTVRRVKHAEASRAKDPAPGAQHVVQPSYLDVLQHVHGGHLVSPAAREREFVACEKVELRDAR